MHRLLAQLARLRETFWVVPALTLVVTVALGLLLPRIDRQVHLPEALAFTGNEDTARGLLTAIAGLGVSIAGVSFSVIVVALVLASQQLSPRVLRSFQRQGLNQVVLALLLGTATYSLFVLGSIGGSAPVPELAVTLAMVLAAISLGVFVLFLHHAIRSLNASTIIRRIAADGHRALAAPYPGGVGRAPEGEQASPDAVPDDGPQTDVRSPRAGYISSVDGHALLAWARENDAFVEQVRGVGDFVVTGGVLAIVHGDAEPDPVASAFLISEERVVDGDIAFPIRQLVDIALKGLSPSVNDPTTAENAMNSVADTLVRYANREEPAPLRLDDDGTPRLRAIAPTLDELVKLGFEQVRRDAANRPSFSVRLLEQLADLQEAAPRARDCAEIERQARLIADHAASLADQEADQAMVAGAFERLHASSGVLRA